MLIRGGMILFCLFLFSQPLFAQQEIITAIEFKGLTTVGPQALHTKLQSQVGQPYARRVVNEDIKRLYSLGIFSHISVTEEITPEGIRLTFIVVENQLLARIEIRGNHAIDEDEIRNELRLEKNRYVSLHLLSLDRYHLTEMYRKKGYLFVKIKTSTHEEGGWTVVTIDIDEGPRVTVEDILFVGNITFDEGDLLQYTQTQENGWFTSHIFDEEVFAEDLILIRNFYRSEGFLDVQVELQDIHFSDDRTEMTITIAVQEGPRYQIGTLKIEGNTLMRLSEIRHRVTLAEGKFFRQTDMAKDQANIEQLYGENSFIGVKVKARWSIPELEGNKVDLTYEIVENRKFYVNKINISGNCLTQDRVIRRKLMVLPNETFNMGKIQESQLELRKLRYFDKITIDLKETDLEDRRDLFFNLEEGKTGSLRFAAGVTSHLGAIGEISFTKNNFDITDLPKGFADLYNGDAFTGAGQSFQLYFQIGEDLFRFRTSFVEPYLFGHNLILGLSFYNTERGRESFLEGRRGVTTALGRRLDLRGHTIIRVQHRYEVIDIGDVDDSAPADVQAVEGSNDISGVMVELTRTTTDDPIIPSMGYSLALSYEMVGVAFGGDYDFSKVNARISWYYPIYTNGRGWKHVIRLGGRIGLEWEHGPSHEIPIFERFFAGGFGSLRGFEFRTVGPKQLDDPVGGKVLWLTTFEYYLPIYRDVVRAVFFTDIGNVTNDIDRELIDTMRVSIGAGLRIKIPFLGPRPFAIDFGFPIKKEDDDDTRLVSFSIGKSF